MKKLVILFALTISLISCEIDDYPNHVVVEGHQTMVVYKIEKITDSETIIKQGTYKYGITDNSDYGWTLYSFNKYKIGDTIRITK